MANPFIAQGTLNRLKANVIVPAFPALNVSPSYMSKRFVSVSFDGDFDNLLPTATGGVTSPEPYVMATVTIGLLRTQALSAQWIKQAGDLSDIGKVSIFPDSSVFPEIDLDTCVIKRIDPGAYDGMNPEVLVTIHGIYYVNNKLWTL